MKIGIIGAMPQEVAVLKQALGSPQITEKAGGIYYSGQLHGLEVVLLQSGIGKVAAALGCAVLINDHQPDFIINTGSAGGLAKHLTVGDIVISDQVRHHDADVTAFGYEIGQMAGQPAAFIADPQLIQLAKQALENKPNLRALTGLICTGDSFVCSAQQQEYIRQHFPEVIAVEMEAAAIAQVCHQFQVPFVVVRAISDVADQVSPMSFDEFLPLAAQHSTAMVLDMLQQLSQSAI